MKNWLLKTLVHRLKPTHANKSDPPRFLILSTTGLGDTLWGTPALRALRGQYPTAYIGVLTSPIGHQVLAHNPHIDELFVVTDPILWPLLKLYRTLKRRQITHVLSFHISQRPLLPFAALLGAQEILGTETLHKGLDFLLTKPLPCKRQHEIQRRLDIVAAVGASALGYAMELLVNAEEEQQAARFLQSLDIPSPLPLVALHPGAKDRFKQWPPEHFIGLGNRLTQNLGCRVFVTGTAAEAKLVRSIASAIEGATPVLNLPLRVMAALMRQMHLVIANDTGPMHVAYAINTATLALFAPTDPYLCGPYFVSKSHVVAKNKTCTPCLKKKCTSGFCLLQIGVDEVYDAAVKLML